jgi:hypothetical protein
MGYRQAPEAYLIGLSRPGQFAPLIGFYFDFHYPRTILNCQNKICLFYEKDMLYIVCLPIYRLLRPSTKYRTKNNWNMD